MKIRNRISLAREIRSLVETKFAGSLLAKKFLRRIGEGKLTRDENPATHFGVYFAGFDPEVKEVFVGLHKKSDLWLFNGGHIDRGESLGETLAREMGEEWGFVHSAAKALESSLLTITEITSDRQICRRHYDIWYFAPVDKTSFSPDESKLKQEFHQIKWAAFPEARKIITDSNTLTAVDAMKKSLM
ncbi:NUDIX domain-containing protein [Candidatus Collierbacteria bacterium]|nr:NUDIX domain-containing protein [Candidatus Collierbacteria bacterium]